jgi:hypothetical protein
VLIRLLLPFGLLLRERGLIGLDPAVPLLFVTKVFPCRVARWIELNHLLVMGLSLRLQSLLFAPGRQFQLGVCLVGGARAAVEVFANGVAVGRIVLDLWADNFRPAPFALI